MTRALPAHAALRLSSTTTRLAVALASALAAPLAMADAYTASDYPSLVQAINAANATDSRSTAHTITLSADITLDGQLPLVLCNVTIDGQGHTLDGADSYRLLFVGVDGATASTLAGQFPDSALGARLAVGLRDLTLAHGDAIGGNGSGQSGGGMGAGGALFVNGAADVTLSNVSFEANQAIGGGGGAGSVGGGGGLGGTGGGGGGGGIFGFGGTAGGGIGGSGGRTYTGTTTDPGGAGGGGYDGNGGDSNNNLPVAGVLSIFGLSGGGGNGAGDGTVSGDPGAANGGGGGGGVDIGGGGGGGFGGLAGGNGDPDNGIPGPGGNGGFGGGGGSSGQFGAPGGHGGFGGGGGYGGGDDPDAASGGFGGGGGFGGHGGFGGGGGGYGGQGGFGGGGGNQNAPGGFGGGLGGGNGALSEGGGGAGMGGAIFIVDGGSLTIAGAGTLSDGAVTGGLPGSGPGNGNPTAGAAYGVGMFLQGTAGTLSLQPPQGATYAIADAIADEVGSDASASANQRGVSIGGAGSVVLLGEHAYGGPTLLGSGTLEVDGSLAASVVSQSAGTLLGNGQVAGLASTGGDIAPGNATAPHAALTVDGDASLGGTLLQLHADATSAQSSQLLVHGTAALTSATIALDFGGATPTPGTTYTVVTATAIQPGTITLQLPPGVDAELVVDATQVQVRIADQANDEIFEDGFDGPANPLQRFARH